MTDIDDGLVRGLDPAWARVRPLVFRTIIGAVVAAGLVGIIAVLIGDFGLVAVQLLLTIVVVVVFALLSWYDADVSSRRSGAFALASIITSMYLLVAGLAKTWLLRPDSWEYDDGSTLGRQFSEWIGLVAIARFALLHVHLLLVIHRRRRTALLRVVARATVGVIALLAALLSFPILVSDLDQPEALWRTIWVVVILDLLGTVVIPLSNALFSPRSEPSLDSLSATWPAPASSWDDAPAPVPVVAVTAPPQDAPVDLVQPPAPVAVGHPAAHQIDRLPTLLPVAAADLVYEPRPGASRVLAWPRYVDGTPLPAQADGSPDFSDVTRS
jgi:hypothetical protein